MAFDFTDAELLAAFLLELPEAEAQEHACAVTAALEPDSDWATSVETLRLLARGSSSGREKVRRILRALRRRR